MTETSIKDKLKALGYFSYASEGRVSPVKAIYSPCSLEVFRGNRLIMAMPDNLAMSRSGIKNKLAKVPPALSEFAGRQQRAAWLYCLEKTLFIPTARHLYLQQLVDLVIRQGYLGRDKSPLERIKSLQEIYEKTQRGEELSEEESATTYEDLSEANSGGTALTLMGASGIGKTAAVKRVLAITPQIINHPSDASNEALTQITYVRVECPDQGSIRSLCLTILKEVERLSGIPYAQRQIKSATADFMKARVAEVLELHKVGLLVIDEMQNLISNHKNRYELFNFIVSLSNSLSVPILYIGTPRLEQFIKQDLRIMRRFGSEGCLRWEPYENDSAEWKAFIEGLWKYSVLKEDETGLSVPEEISSALYNGSQGITDLVIKLFILSQMRALWCGIEELSPELITETYKKDFKNYHQLLEALRKKDIKTLEEYGDVKFEESFFEASFLNYAQELALQSENAEKMTSAEQTAVETVSQVQDLKGNLFNKLNCEIKKKKEEKKQKSDEKKRALSQKSAELPKS